MTKQDIINWKGNALVCELRDKRRGLLVNKTFIMWGSNGGFDLSLFDNNLKYYRNFADKDIVKLYEITEQSLNGGMDYWQKHFTDPFYSNLIWERDETSEKETDFSDVVSFLHEQARKKEAKARSNTHDAHVAMDVARSLRIAANYLDGVSVS